MRTFDGFRHLGLEMARIAFNMKIADVVGVQLDGPVSDFAMFTNPKPAARGSVVLMVTGIDLLREDGPSKTEIMDRLLQASNPLAVGL